MHYFLGEIACMILTLHLGAVAKRMEYISIPRFEIERQGEYGVLRLRFRLGEGLLKTPVLRLFFWGSWKNFFNTSKKGVILEK